LGGSARGGLGTRCRFGGGKDGLSTNACIVLRFGSMTGFVKDLGFGFSSGY
jgi:hypothetical protein